MKVGLGVWMGWGMDGVGYGWGGVWMGEAVWGGVGWGGVGWAEACIPRAHQVKKAMQSSKVH